MVDSKWCADMGWSYATIETQSSTEPCKVNFDVLVCDY